MQIYTADHPRFSTFLPLSTQILAMLRILEMLKHEMPDGCLRSQSILEKMYGSEAVPLFCPEFVLEIIQLLGMLLCIDFSFG